MQIALISNAPVVVISTSLELPAILTPPAPFNVRAPALVDNVEGFSAPVNVRAPAAVVKLEAVAAVTGFTPAEESIVVAAALISNAPVVVISTSLALPAILTPLAPFNVRAPAAVVKLDAVAASIETPPLESIVVAAALISNAPVVVISISLALPTILTPPAPSNVRAPVPTM